MEILLHNTETYWLKYKMPYWILCWKCCTDHCVSQLITINFNFKPWCEKNENLSVSHKHNINAMLTLIPTALIFTDPNTLAAIFIKQFKKKENWLEYNCAS